MTDLSNHDCWEEKCDVHYCPFEAAFRRLEELEAEADEWRKEVYDLNSQYSIAQCELWAELAQREADKVRASLGWEKPC